MNNEIIEQLIEQGQPPKRTRGRPFGTFKENNITADEKAYNKLQNILIIIKRLIHNTNLNAR